MHAGSLRGALYSLNGQLIGSAPLGSAGDFGQAATGSNGIYLLHSGNLSRVNRDGSVQQLETGLPKGLIGPVIAPDGTQWMYAVVEWNAPGTTATTSIYIDGKGQFHHRIAVFERDASAGGGYLPIVWIAQGIMLGTVPLGPTLIGPYPGERDGRGSVVVMDPGTGSLSRPVTPPSCRYGDVALSGPADLACFETNTDGTIIGSILIMPPAAPAIRIAVPPGDGAGQLHFTPDGKQFIFTVAHWHSGGTAQSTLDAYAVSSIGGTPRLLARDVNVTDTLTNGTALAQLLPESQGPIVALALATGATTTIVPGGASADPAGAVGVVCQ